MEFYSGKYGLDRRRAVGDFGQFDTIAYASGDILSSSAVSFASVARSTGFSGKISRIMLKENATTGSIVKPALRLWVFSASVTPSARNSPQAFTTTQLDVFVGTISIANTDWIDCASLTASVEKELNLPYVLQSNSTTLWIVPEIRGAYTFNSTDRIVAQLITEVD